MDGYPFVGQASLRVNPDAVRRVTSANGTGPRDLAALSKER